MDLHVSGCSGCNAILPLLRATLANGAFAADSAAMPLTAPTPNAGQAQATAAGATTVYLAEKVVTMESAAAANAVAVSGPRTVAVGMLDEVTQQLQPGSYVIDRRFEKRVIFPGFIEQHLHPLLGALSMSAVVIAIEDWAIPDNFAKAAKDNAEYVARLTAAVTEMKNAPAGEMLFTWGYHQYFHGNVYRPELDAIGRDRPIVIWHRSCHELIFNSVALEKYGITEASLAGHGLASTQANFARGHFYEKGLELVLVPIAKELATRARMKSGVERLKSYVRSKGITTICEPGTQLSRRIQTFWETTLGGDDVGFRTYFIADGRSLYDQNKSDLGTLVAKTNEFASWGRGHVAWLPKQVKLFADGAIFSQLMQMEQPYLDGHRGEWIAEPADYEAAFALYWDAGFHIHTHVNGDGGLQVVTDTLARNMRANPRGDHRFTVVHFAMSTEEQIARLAELGAIISANPYYPVALADRYSEIGLGPERANSMVRLGSAVRQNMSISLHSDMPMAPADPLFLAWCAVNRTTLSGRTADPSQKITAEKALRAVTIEAAYSLGLEGEIGSIKAGKKSDFTVLDRDPLTIDPAEIDEIRVVATIFEGRIVSPDAPADSVRGASETPSEQRAISQSALASHVG